VIDRTGAAGRRVGRGLDGVFSYKPYAKTQFGMGIGHVFPGTFLKRAAGGHGYTYPYVFFATSF